MTSLRHLKYSRRAAASWEFPSVLLLGVFQILGTGCAGSTAPPEHCSPDLSHVQIVDFVEPNTPTIPPSSESPLEDATVAARVTFPPESNSGDRWRSYYWLTGVEDLQASIAVRLGEGASELDEGEWRSFLFIDGQQTRFELNGEDVLSHAETLVRDNRDREFSIRVPSESISDGAHSVLLYVRPPSVSALGITLRWFMFKNGTEFVSMQGPQNVTREAYSGAGSRLLWKDVGEPFFGTGRGPPTDGRFDLLLTVESIQSELRECEAANQTYLLVGILDDLQIPLGHLGMRPFLEVSSSESLHVPFSLSDLPVDGAKHRVDLILVPAHGHFVEDRDGDLTPWGESPDVLGAVGWE